MAEDKVVVTLDSFEQRLMVSALTDFRNDLIRVERPTEDVDVLLLKVIDAAPQKERKKADRPELRGGDEPPILYHALRKQLENDPRFAAVLRTCHRNIPLHPAQLPAAGRTRLRPLGFSRTGEREVCRQDSGAKQDPHAERLRRAGRPQTPAQS